MQQRRLIGQFGPLRESGRLPFDSDREIDALRPVLESELWALHRLLDERIGVFPDAARAAFACEVVCREEEACGRIALYWLLDRSEEVRIGAADGFLERALQGIVEPVSAALVPLVRNWMPAEPARAVPARPGVAGSAQARPVRAPARRRLAPGAVRRIAAGRRGGPGVRRAARRRFAPRRGLGGDRRWAGDRGSVHYLGRRGRGGDAGVGRRRRIVRCHARRHRGRVCGCHRRWTRLRASAPGGAARRRARLRYAGTAAAADDGAGLAEAGRPGWLDCAPDGGGAGRTGHGERGLAGAVSRCGGLVGRNSRHTGNAGEGVTGDELGTAVRGRLEERRNHWARVILLAAHVSKEAAEVDWRSFAATASALLEGRPLASLPVVDCICKVTAEAWLAESYGRLSDGDDGSAELFRLIGAAAWPEGHPPSKENEAWAVGYLTAAVHSPLGAGPDRLIAAAAERMAPGNNDVPAEHLATVFTSGHADLQAGYRDAQFVAAMFSGLDKRELRAWAQGLAFGVGILDAEWLTEMFLAEERRSASQIAALA